MVERKSNISKILFIKNSVHMHQFSSIKLICNLSTSTISLILCSDNVKAHEPMESSIAKEAVQ